MGGLRMAMGLTVLTIINYILGQMVFSADKGGVKPANKRAFYAAIAIDAGSLILFKVLSGLSDKVVLPLGFSFYLFKMISYQVDLFRGEITRRPDIIDTVVYFTMFPQVTQGPIMRWNNVGFEKRERTVSVKAFNDGLFFFVLGLGMKVLLADPLSLLWYEIEKIGFESISTPLAWMGAVGFSLRLYMDFWGYSLMAAGIGMMLGFHFVVNFVHPYWARDPWRMVQGLCLYPARRKQERKPDNDTESYHRVDAHRTLARHYSQFPDLGRSAGFTDHLGEIRRGRTDLIVSDHRTSPCLVLYTADMGDLRDP